MFTFSILGEYFGEYFHISWFYCLFFIHCINSFSSIGQEYEIKLYNEIKILGLAFRDEESLRKFGYDKTPDFKLEVPIAIDGFIVHWIESKALFGSKEFHEDYIKNQYSCYWNR